MTYGSLGEEFLTAAASLRGRLKSMGHTNVKTPDISVQPAGSFDDRNASSLSSYFVRACVRACMLVDMQTCVEDVSLVCSSLEDNRFLIFICLFICFFVHLFIYLL